MYGLRRCIQSICWQGWTCDFMCWPRDDQMAHKILFICVSVFLKESIWISEHSKGDPLTDVSRHYSIHWRPKRKKKGGWRKGKLSFLSCDVHFLLPLDIRAPGSCIKYFWTPELIPAVLTLFLEYWTWTKFYHHLSRFSSLQMTESGTS